MDLPFGLHYYDPTLLVVSEIKPTFEIVEEQPLLGLDEVYAWSIPLPLGLAEFLKELTECDTLI